VEFPGLEQVVRASLTIDVNRLFVVIRAAVISEQAPASKNFGIEVEPRPPEPLG